MTRLIAYTAQSPLRVLKSDLSAGDAVYVCRCGLSANANGFCDGSHKATLDEQAGRLYMYERRDGQMQRIAAPHEAPK